MIDALITGRVYEQLAERTGKSGKNFAVEKVRADGAGGEAMFLNFIAFDSAPCTALLALGDGDSVALSGSLTLNIWTDKDGHARPGLDLVAQQVVSAYSTTKKRHTLQASPATPGQRPRYGAWKAIAAHNRLDF